MFVAEKGGSDPSVTQYEPTTDILARLNRTLRRKHVARSVNRYRSTAGSALSNFSDDRAPFGRDPWRGIWENDLIQLHWVAGFLDYRDFFASVPAGRPVVWTLHDMFPFTGGCHWNQGCARFAQSCGACPQLVSNSDSDLTRHIWQRKQESLRQLGPIQLHVVTPSRWLQDEVRRSSLLSRFPCTVIPYGLDLEVFAPRDRRVAREILQIPLDARVVAFVADGVQTARKGFSLLVQALSGLRSDNNVFLLAVGWGHLPDLQGFPNVHIKQLNHDGLLSCAYSAADIFVAPSLQDNLPNTVLESIACGIPVAGFAAGGISDAVRPGETGLLARPGDVAELRSSIVELLRNDEKRNEMSSNCRRIALQEYSLEIQARRYVALYEEMISASDTRRGRSGSSSRSALAISGKV